VQQQQLYSEVTDEHQKIVINKVPVSVSMPCETKRNHFIGIVKSL
jgi:hypothetical protein